MMDLTNRQWIKHTMTHPFEGFEDMRWKKAGSVRYACIIVLLWFVASVFYSRLYGFQFYVETDKMFNIIPYIVQTIVLFLTWVVGNWAVCTLLDGEGNICVACDPEGETRTFPRAFLSLLKTTPNKFRSAFKNAGKATEPAPEEN